MPICGHWCPANRLLWSSSRHRPCGRNPSSHRVWVPNDTTAHNHHRWAPVDANLIRHLKHNTFHISSLTTVPAIILWTGLKSYHPRLFPNRGLFHLERDHPKIAVVLFISAAWPFLHGYCHPYRRKTKDLEYPRAWGLSPHLQDRLSGLNERFSVCSKISYHTTVLTIDSWIISNTFTLDISKLRPFWPWLRPFWTL